MLWGTLMGNNMFPEWDQVTGSGHVSMNQMGGVLTVKTDGSDGKIGGYVSNPMCLSILGSSLSVEVESVPSDPKIGVAFQLADAGNAMTVHVGFRASNGMLSFVQVASTMSPPPTTVPYDATNQAYWRFREAGGMLYAETSKDKGTWAQLASMTTPAWANNVLVNLSIAATSSTGNASVEFTDIGQ
jgi:hypothetical protein